MLAADLYSGVGIRNCGLVELRRALVWAGSAVAMTPEEALLLVASWLSRQVETGELRDATANKALGILTRYVKYQQVRRPVADISAVTSDDVVAFLHAPTLGAEHRVPKSTTVANRRWALGLFFSTLRSLGRCDRDPLVDVGRVRRQSTSYRPLADEEVSRCRSVSARTTRDTRGPAAWALAEATATTSEIALVVVGDVDLAGRCVWLTGGARNLPRWGYLTDWGADAIGRRLRSLDGGTETPVVFEGGGSAESQQASACAAVAETLRRAGFGPDRTVRPLSVPAWAGRKVYAETGDLALVAARLGVRDVGRVARIIGVAAPDAPVPPPHRTGQ